MTLAKMTCHQCKKEIPLLGIVGRREECPFCRADLHCCKNCVHYDPQSYNECREPQADRVLEKDRGNFCDFFSPGSNLGSTQKKDDLMAAAEALFKKNN